MGKLKLRLVALVVATTASVVVPYVGTASAEPTEDSCTAQMPRRSYESLPACTVVVQCPVESPDGCAFAASIKIASSKTRGTAQGTLRVTNLDTGESTEFVCSARAAIVAYGPDAGCSTIVSAFIAPGTTFSVTCEWTGDTISVRPMVRCAAAMEPFGEG
jgi:hypothetical protein